MARLLLAPLAECIVVGRRIVTGTSRVWHADAALPVIPL
jgi:hypothetical protein